MGKKRVAGSLVRIPEGGPIDTFRHKFRDRGSIDKHVKELIHNKRKVEKRIENEERYIEDEKNYLEKTKEYNEAQLQDRKDKQFEASQRNAAANQERQNIAVDDVMGASNKIISSTAAVAKFAWNDVIKAFILAIWHGFVDLVRGSWRGSKDLTKGAWRGATDLTKGIWTGVSGPVAVTADVIVKPFWEFFLAFLLVILVLLIILLVILLILGAFGVFSSDGGGGGGGGGGGINCKGGRIPNTVNINLHNFGKFYDSNKISSGLNTEVDNYVRRKQQYIKIPEFKLTTKDLMTRPATYLNGLMGYMYGSMLTNETVQWCANSAQYARNYAVKNINSITGNTDEFYSNVSARNEDKKGRCDNIINVDSNIFANRKLLQEKEIGNVQTVVNIGRPKDVEWDMPEMEYSSTDFKKLPPSLVKKKDSRNISLEDKKSIVIPWITKNNSYVLSCDDAYFKGNPSEKAHVLIDNDDFTCSLNTENRTIVFNEEKKRYKATNDLSAFL